jgi:ubiquinone/menaquinone biosynthesis C-methylase UbiE
MSITRKPHAVMDIASRKLKAKKIEIILDLFEKKRPYTMLEVGTGSGGIAQYFGSHESFDIKVDSVDVIDSRLVFDDYNFHLVSGCQLPFTDESYDAVISNHVIDVASVRIVACIERGWGIVFGITK